MLCDWRRQRDKGLIAVDRKRWRTPTQSEVRENVDLKRQAANLTKELAATRMVVDVQKNVSALLGIALESAEPENTP